MIGIANTPRICCNFGDAKNQDALPAYVPPAPVPSTQDYRTGLGEIVVVDFAFRVQGRQDCGGHRDITAAFVTASADLVYVLSILGYVRFGHVVRVRWMGKLPFVAAQG